jgi:small subunit ribosomal protein S2
MQRAQFQLLNLKKKLQRSTKEKTQGKTVQEIDREKLEEKFSKDKKETLN